MKNTLIIVIASLFICSTYSSAQTDCTDAAPACTTPDFEAISDGTTGNVQELDGNNISNPTTNPNPGNSGCLLSGELNPNWISITAISNGTLEFALGEDGGTGFFDWAMWANVDGNACSDITNNLLPPVACNWNQASDGFTGMAAPGNLPTGANPGNFETAINVNAGDNFILMFSNFSAVNGLSVAMDFTGTAEISCNPTIQDQTICVGDTATFTILEVPVNITSFSWSPNTNISDATAGPSVDVWPTDTTIYTVTMVSPDSIWTKDVTVNVNPISYPNAGVDDSTCYSAAIGYNFDATLGTPINSLTWEFTNGPSSASNAIFQPNNTSLTSLTKTTGPGLFEYVIHEIDANGVCPEATDTILIYFSQETHTFDANKPLCFGGSDGDIMITSTGSLGAIEYSFDGGTTFKPNSDSTGLTSGTYNIISRDILGCTFESTVVIEDTTEVSISYGPLPDTTVCQNGTAVLYANASNGTTFDYFWNHNPGNTNGTQLISPINDSIIEVYALNEFGCSSDTVNLKIYVHSPLNAEILLNDTICPGDNGGVQINAVTGGFQTYNYSWTESGTAISDILNTIQVAPLVQTEYCVTITDVCETTPITRCMNFIMREVPQPVFTSDIREVCLGNNISFTDATSYVQSETETDSLIWHIEGMSYNDSSLIHTFNNPGEFNVQLEIYTQYGCHGYIDSTSHVTVHEIPEATFYILPNPTTIFDTEVQVINNTEGENLTFYWSAPGALPASSTAESPALYYPEGLANDYPVYLTVANSFGCTDSTQDIVHVISDVIIYAPNAFTPDGDQMNNDWRIYIDGIDTYDFQLLLFNRWGEIVWESHNPDAAWDATYNGKPVDEGTYVWRVIAKDASNDKKHEFRGTVNVFK